jgi:hypothetical protein
MDYVEWVQQVADTTAAEWKALSPSERLSGISYVTVA